MNEGFNEALLEFCKKGELSPLTTIDSLKQFSKSTICAWAKRGILPALKIRGRVLSHPSLIESALRSFLPRSQDTPLPTPEKLGQNLGLLGAKGRLAKRGLKVGGKN